MAEGFTQAWYRAHEPKGESARHWTVQWPEGAEQRRIPAAVQAMLKFDEGQNVVWRSGGGFGWQGFWLRWNPATSVYQRARSAMSKGHTPEACLSGAGMELSGKLPELVVETDSGNKVPFQRYLFKVEQTPVHVFFTVLEDTTGNSPRFIGLQRANRIRAALQGVRNAGQTTLEFAVTGTPDPDRAAELFREEMAQRLRCETKDEGLKTH